VAADVQRHLHAPLWGTQEGSSPRALQNESGAAAATVRLDAGGCGQMRVQIQSDSFPWTKSGQAAVAFLFLTFIHIILKAANDKGAGSLGF